MKEISGLKNYLIVCLQNKVAIFKSKSLKNLKIMSFI